MSSLLAAAHTHHKE